MDTKIEVRGEMIELTVHQRAKTVWIATGLCLGRRLEVKASSHAAALKHWRKAAEHRSI